MPPRKSRRTAAVAAQSAIAADIEDERQAPSKSRRGRKPGPKSNEPLSTPVRRKQESTAPPDTIGAVRRRRSTTTAAKKATPKTRSSPRNSRGRKAAAQSPAAVQDSDNGVGSESEAAEHDLGLEELSLSDDAIPETPTRRPGRPKKTTPASKEYPVVEIDSSPAQRGRKRKTSAEPDAPSEELDISNPPAKRGRARKPQPATAATPKSTRGSRSSASQSSSTFADIVSPSRFEKSRTQIQPARSVEIPAHSDDGGDWRAKYEELLQLRQSQPEKEYEEFRKKAQERFDAAEDVIKSLRKEVANLKRKGAQIKTDDIEANVRKALEKDFEKQKALLRQQVETLTQDLAAKEQAVERLEKHRRLTETSTDYNLRQKLHVMQEVTGLVIDDLVAEDDGLSYVCRQAGPAASVRYVLTAFDDMPTDFQYTPFGDATALAALPEYLREPISFERTAAHMFHWRLCNHLHQSADLNGT
ncbi:hypothetical protein IWW36_003862 [Coemansia brasiliensis]|uniref:Monopolin complex subunit Csm1/Pcs1 C-terminal domain-containing protein n=1 Tax=Coemansia brasiliensis TaxID=2650707 RepID=A0A9W8I4E3_9FUNG|nr:hypothetical protein IWW36_003862 [Coemansia brasiliensis]